MIESYKQLLTLYEAGELVGEKLALFLQLTELEENQKILAQFIDEKAEDPDFLLDENELLTNKAVAKLRAAIAEGERPAPVSIPVLPAMQKRYITRWISVAAAVIVLLIGGYWLWVVKEDKLELPTITKVMDVKAPDANRATITLADGRTVYLDSVGSGNLAQQGNIQLVKLGDGQIVYEVEGGNSSVEMQYNTLVNPRGSRVIDMTLSDGTKVWLNAGTSITYPIVFLSNERKVSVKGEAYFEVVSDVSKPFLVNTGNADIKVLGTHFNVMNYAGEPSTQTTLLEGSVQIITDNNELVLKPGQQSVLTLEGRLSKRDNVDTELITAWKNGLQSFRHIDLKTLLRQVERWYDVDVSYETEIPTSLSFTGEGISKNVSLLEFLQVLGSKEVTFEIDGNNRKVKVKKGKN